MSNWNIRASTLFVLGGLVILMLVIVVLPDVDLPDTAFHRGTAPVVVHAQANSAPGVVVVASVLHVHNAAGQTESRYSAGEFVITPHPNFRSILLRSIRC